MAGIERSGKEGFSLLEVLIALVILAVGLLALAMFQITAIKGNAIASRWTVATQLSQDKLEDFRHIAWNNIVSSNAAGFDTGTMRPVYAALPAAAGSTFADTGSGVTYYTVYFVNNNSSTFKSITVWTCWRDDQSQWHNVMLTTQRARTGGV
jgi:type IV pilus assembly protein PilV